jgi:TonB-dependent SusC/RagA subfamily outer membrane receptor
MDANENGLEYVSVKGADTTVLTDTNGYFEIPQGACNSIIVITNRYIETKKELVVGRTWIDVTVKLNYDTLNENEIVNDGIEKRVKARAPGVFYNIKEKEYKQRVYSNPISGLEAQVPGLLFNKNILMWMNQPFIELRGSSTIHSGTGPLIVVDDYPLPSVEAFAMINMNDIKSVTVLKDAAATSSWGVRAGNGVIVFTTKSGRYKRPLKFFATNSVTITTRPNLGYMPSLSAAENIDMEKARYKAGYYNSSLKQPSALLSPVVEVLFQMDSGIISPDLGMALLSEWSTRDVRNDLRKWVYRPAAITNQHFISAEGGGDNFNYYLSAGYDGEQLPMMTANRKRITTNSRLQLRRKKFEMGMNTYYSYGVQNEMPELKGLYPYARLKNDAGQPEMVYADIRQSYKDNMAQWMQDWSYRPLQELKERSRTQKNTLYRMNLTGSYALSKNWNAKLIYQHDQGRTQTDDLSTSFSYYARHIANKFATIHNGTVNYIVPRGGVLDWQLSEYRSDKMRGQLNYQGIWKKKLQITALAGAESNRMSMDTTAVSFYDFHDDRRPLSLPYSIPQPLSYDTTKAYIPHVDNHNAAYEYYGSFYGNGSVIFKDRYTLSFSARLDRSNLLAANTIMVGGMEMGLIRRALLPL